MRNEEKVILQLSLKLLQLQSSRDAKGAAALLDDELETIDENGHRLDKQHTLQQLLVSHQNPQNLAEIRISLWRDSALETGCLHTQTGTQICRFSYSRLWIRRDDSWCVRCIQLTSQH